MNALRKGRRVRSSMRMDSPRTGILPEDERQGGGETTGWRGLASVTTDAGSPFAPLRAGSRREPSAAVDARLPARLYRTCATAPESLRTHAGIAFHAAGSTSLPWT